MKILVGLDDTKIAENVITLAHQHAKAFKADVHILISLRQSPELEKADIDKADGKLRKIETVFKNDDISCKTEASVSVQTPGEDLVQYVANNDIDEIIIGIRKKSKVGKLIFGSTAQYVILKAPCPVVSVK
jgi:nucleotide-binding universal stress UspA family protein